MNSNSSPHRKIRVSALIDAVVVLEDGEDFGSIADVVVDQPTASIDSIIVQRHGALTATDNFYRVDWSILKLNANGDELVLSMTEELIGNLSASSNLSDLIETEAT